MYNSPNNQFQNYDPNMIKGPFQTPYQRPETILERADYRNPGTAIHNNLKDNLLHEYIKEYTIILDSKARDPRIYPSPYKYSILVNQNNSSDRSGIILKELKNVKYIKVESVILPRKWKVVNSEGEPEFDDNTDALNDRFVMLKLSNLVSNNVYSNNQRITKDEVLLTRSKVDNENFFKAKSLNMGYEIFYDNNNLGNITRFDIEFTTDDGDNLGNCINIGIDTNIREEENLMHPMNKLRQNLIVLKVGIMENSMNKMNWG